MPISRDCEDERSARGARAKSHPLAQAAIDDVSAPWSNTDVILHYSGYHNGFASLGLASSLYIAIYDRKRGSASVRGGAGRFPAACVCGVGSRGARVDSS